MFEATDEVAGELDALLPTAGHPMVAERSVRYRVEHEGRRRLRVIEDDDLLVGALTPRQARDLVHQRLHRRAFELAARKGWVRLHGGVIDVDGRRIVVIGPSGSGKTSLCVRLLLDGGAFQGDESLLVRDGMVLAVPRPLHLKVGAAGVNPDIGGALASAPTLDGVALVDPVAHLGRPWSLTVARAELMVILDPTGRPPATGSPLATTEALPHVVAELFPVIETKPALLAAATALCSGATCVRLTTGDTTVMSAAIRRHLG